MEFYFNKENKNIEEIKTIINNLKYRKLNCLEKNYRERYSFYPSTYKEKADERAIKSKSIFFGLYLTKIKKNIKIMRMLVLMRQWKNLIN